MIESKKQLQAIRREHDIAVGEGNEAYARGIRKANPDLFTDYKRDDRNTNLLGVLVGVIWFAAIATLLWAAGVL